MEQRLIQAKGEWATAEHEKEQLRCELAETAEQLEHTEMLLKEERSNRGTSLMTTRTGTSKTDSDNCKV